jgi:hypothetical protein
MYSLSPSWSCLENLILTFKETSYNKVFQKNAISLQNYPPQFISKKTNESIDFFNKAKGKMGKLSIFCSLTFQI